MAESKVRATKKMLLSRSMNMITLMMDDRDLDGVKNASAELKTLFNEFNSAHDAVVLTLEDGDAIETAVKYYDAVFDKYRSIMSKIRTFTADPERVVEAQHSTSDSPMTSSIVQALNLPRIEIAKFSGDVREYHTFMTVFKQCVESVTTDGHTRLSQLLHHTTGDAYNAIKSCLGDGGDAGYILAMKRLRTRFGSPHVICETIMSDLKMHPDAHTAVDLRQFADLLITASHILKEHGMYSEIDNQNFILSMCMKLQLRIRYKWRDHAADKLQTSNAYPRFSDFVSFVERHADVLNDPVYGGDALISSTRKPSGTSSAPSNRNISSFTTAVKRKMCILCNNDHRLFRCHDFMSKTLDERISYVSDKRLCNVCLSQGHTTNDCTTNYMCPVNDCNGKHSKLIHVDKPSLSCGNASLSLNVTNCHTSVLMPVLPVTINGIYNTYASLDTGSSHSFCSDRLKNILQLSGPTTMFDLNTLNNSAQVKSQMVKFEVVSRNNFRSMSMKNVRVIDSIPVQSASCDVSNYAHLKDLHCPGDVQVDVLIGQDYPAILKPLDVRSGREDEPYAVLSVLGWTLNGPVPPQPSRARVTSHLISSFVIEKKQTHPSHEDQGCQIKDVRPLHDVSSVLPEGDISKYVEEDGDLPQSDVLVQKLEDKQSTCTVADSTNSARLPTRIPSHHDNPCHVQRNKNPVDVTFRDVAVELKYISRGLCPSRFMLLCLLFTFIFVQCASSSGTSIEFQGGGVLFLLKQLLVFSNFPLELLFHCHPCMLPFIPLYYTLSILYSIYVPYMFLSTLL